MRAARSPLAEAAIGILRENDRGYYAGATRA